MQRRHTLSPTAEWVKSTKLHRKRSLNAFMEETRAQPLHVRAHLCIQMPKSKDDPPDHSSSPPCHYMPCFPL